MWRRLKDSEFWTSEPFSRPQAWVDLVMLANHRDGFFRVKGQRVDVGRGQLAWSEISLSARWHWSRGKVRRFLSELSSNKVQQIVQQKNNLTSLITIINYEQYQGDGTADGTADGQQTDSRRYTNKNVKNEKNEKKKRREGISGGNGIPEWIPKDLWADFKEFRIRIKAPLTDRATKNIISELEKLREEGSDPCEVLNQSITRGWRGVFHIKKNRDDCLPGWSEKQ